MRTLNLRKRTVSRLAIVLALISVVIAASLVVAVSGQSRAHGRLQEQADNAALAGVTALAAAGDMSDV